MKILIVSWAWPPIGRIGAMRPIGMAREWVAAGHEVHVLTGPGDRGGECTPDLLPAAQSSGAVVHRATAPGLPLTPYRPVFGLKRPLRIAQPLPRWHQVLGQWRGFPDLQRSWIRPALRLGRDLQSRERFDLVWTSSPPESVHFIGRGLAATGLPWIADFRDQWAEYLLARWDPLSRWLIDRITAWTLARAVAVTANTEGVAASINRASQRSVVCVRNGFDWVDPTAKPVRQRTLGYFGRVDPLFQHPERLWPALRSLRDAGRSWRVQFYAAPGGGGGAEIAVPEDLTQLVEVKSLVPHPEAVRLMQSMTALLILAWESRGGDATVAGKLYEYIGSRRPVLVCAPPGFEARRLVEQTHTGLGAWGDPSIGQALLRLETFQPDSAERETLTRQAMARDLLRLFEQTLQGPRA